MICHRMHRVYVVTYSFIDDPDAAEPGGYYHDFEFSRAAMLEDVRRAFECAPRLELRADLFSSMRVER